MRVLIIAETTHLYYFCWNESSPHKTKLSSLLYIVSVKECAFLNKFCILRENHEIVKARMYRHDLLNWGVLKQSL